MAAAVLRVPYVRVLAGCDPNIRRPRQQVNVSFIENRFLERRLNAEMLWGFDVKKNETQRFIGC
jgi:hypothetical protein